MLSFFNFDIQERTGPKRMGGNRFYKGHKEIAEKASHHFKQASHHFKKASIPLKMYLKSLEKTSISL
jgi:hypothetical protein